MKILDRIQNGDYGKDRDALIDCYFDKNSNLRPLWQRWWKLLLFKIGYIKSPKVHKEVRFPYYVELPLDEGQTEWTIYKVRDREDEKEIMKDYPELLN